MMEWNEIVGGISKRQLNLDKIFKLNTDDKKIIMDLFNDLLNSVNGTTGILMTGGMKVDYSRACIIYTTLVNEDYLVTRRELNLEKILD